MADEAATLELEKEVIGLLNGLGVEGLTATMDYLEMSIPKGNASVLLKRILRKISSTEIEEMEDEGYSFFMV